MKDKITVKRMVQNALYMIRFAAQYDRRLVITTILLYVSTFTAEAINDTYILKKIIDGFTNRIPLGEVMKTLSVSFVLVIFIIIVGQIRNEWVSTRLVSLCGRINLDIINNNNKMDLICYDNPEFYDLYVITSGNVDAMVEKSVLVGSKMLGCTFALVSAAGMIATISPIIAIFPILGFCINLLTRFKIEMLNYSWDVENRKALRRADYSRRVFYQPEYAKECKLTDVKTPLRKQFDEALENASDVGRKYGPKITWISLLNWISVFTVCSFFAVPATLGYLAIVLKSIALGDVAAGNNAANYVRRNLDQINFALVDLQQIGLFTEKFRKLMEYKPSIEGSKGNADVRQDGSVLEINDIKFKYPGAGKNVIDGISFSVKEGSKVAIVGENGAGKTTFVKLLMRLYDVTAGEIKYGGNDIKDYSVDEYRKQVDVVFQDYNIYSLSLGENVMMREINADDEGKILSALERADFMNAYNRLPDGINTVLTREFDENGTSLSGGESQKVAIARAYSAKEKAKIVILDEPSSAIDPVSEYKLNKNLIENAQGSTIIFISHRLSTTRMADKIYLFENGKIAEQGTHSELMTLNGKYRKMFDRQAQNYILS